MSEEKRYALISVWDKAGITELARSLVKGGYSILSSSGTAKHLEQNGVEVTEVVDLTGVPAILGGRVKTLHPKVMGGILARRGLDADERDREAHGIPLVDVVVCTLYPFEETAKGSPTTAELIEKIDIGGVSLIRAAAKNHAFVTVVTDPADYERVGAAAEAGRLDDALRQELAIKAFRVTASYDATINIGLSHALKDAPRKEGMAEERVIPLRLTQSLRYGENPYQSAGLYTPTLAQPAFIQHSGKELSYNNLLDLDTLLRARRIFDGSQACVIVKHTTPCGTAVGASEAEAYERALACDPVSAFGGIVGFTGRVNLALARLLCEPERFFEIAAAPAFDDDALAYLRETKPNMRALEITGKYRPHYQVTSSMAGWLIQSGNLPETPTQASGRWVGKPRPDLWDDLIFAWRTAVIVKSNAIVLAKGGAAVGIGGGFTNRVDAAEYAIKMAGDKARGSVMASDAFFPFPDTVELASKAGVEAIIEPGGSLRDKEVEETAEKLGVTLFVGGTRTFRH